MKKGILLFVVGIVLTTILSGCNTTLPDRIESIEVEQENIVVEVGERLPLKIKPKPENAINTEMIMTSQDESIATINGIGEVVGVGVGETSVTIKAKKGDATKTLPVKVVAKGSIPVALSNEDIKVYFNTKGQDRIVIKSNDKTKKITEGQTLSIYSKNTQSSMVLDNRKVEVIQVVDMCFDTSYLDYERGNQKQLNSDIISGGTLVVELKSKDNIVSKSVINVAVN